MTRILSGLPHVWALKVASGVFFSSGHGASIFTGTWSKQHNGYIYIYVYIYIMYTYMEIRFHSFLGRLWDTTRNNQTEIQSTYDLCRWVGLRLGDEPQPEWWESCYGKSPCLGRSLNYKCAITRVWQKKCIKKDLGPVPNGKVRTIYSLVGDFKHEFYFPFHIWDVIRNHWLSLHHFSRCCFNHQTDYHPMINHY